MNDLPELPFEKVLSYLSLEDRLKSMAVSRRWYNKTNSFNVKNLSYSQVPIGFIYQKSRWVSDAFAQNFINSTRFTSFFNTFDQTILFNLKHLRLCELDLNADDRAAFASTLNSFGQLEKLDLILFGVASSKLEMKFKLNLPMLNSIHFDQVYGIKKLTLETQRLQKVRLEFCSNLRLGLVHTESVEWLVTDNLKHIPLKNLKSLKHLYSASSSKIDSTLLSSLEQLKEIHLKHYRSVSQLFEQKQRYGHADLKIYLCGLLLNGPEDPAIDSLTFEVDEVTFRCLAENPSRLADEIPFLWSVPYTTIEHVNSESEINVLNRFTDFEQINVTEPVKNIQRFLDFLKNSGHIVALEFSGDHPQDLFDRLPEHCAVEILEIDCAVPDFGFLFRLTNLIEFYIKYSIDIELIGKVLEELQFLSLFDFKYRNKQVTIEIDSSKRFKVLVDWKETNVADLNAAIEFMMKNAPEE